MVTKNFDAWNVEKKYINNLTPVPFWNEREIWWCTLGLNVGSELDGKGIKYERPVLILRGLSRDTCIIIPLTTSLKTHPSRVPIGVIEGKEATALISQIRVIDTKRLINKVCFLDKDIFELIRKTTKDVL